jgi:hypothetical protein
MKALILILLVVLSTLAATGLLSARQAATAIHKGLDTRPTGTDAHHAPCGRDAIADESRILWTDEAVRRLHVAVLHHALGVLKSKARGSTAEKCEVLRWIWAPAVFCWVTRIHGGVATRVPIYRRQLPFMFETCCAFDGQRPEVLRALLEEVLQPLLEELALESLTT